MSLRAFDRHIVLVLLLLTISLAQPAEAQNAANSATQIGAAGFDELKAGVAAAQTQGNSNEAISGLVEAWVNQVGIDRLSIDQVQWCLEHSLPNAKDRSAFSVVWTGLLTPPRSGKYTFSVSPINVNSPFGRNPVKHTIAVSVADTKVINAGPEQDQSHDQRLTTRSAARPNSFNPESPNQWQWKSDPIDLQTGQPVPLRVEMHYECREPSPADSPSAILSWEGPGIGRQAIPADVLTLADGSEKGLRAEYSLHDGNGPPHAIIQTSPNIDFAWTTPADVAPANPALVAQLTERLWQLATSPDYLAECAARRSVHPFFENSRSSQFLTSAQRREFLQLLTDNKALLSCVEDRQLLSLFRAFRFGAEDDAIDLLGTWMQLNADITPKITADFFRENRQVYAELAMHLASQQQGAYQTLQDRYLEMPDGRCALPVAYTLSYSCRILPPPFPSIADAKPILSPAHEWDELLDSMLEVDDTKGDGRINWLIAKAHSLESRAAVILGPVIPQEDLLAGMDVITEAQLVATSAPSRARVYAEEVARLAVTNRTTQAKEVMRAAAQAVNAKTLKNWTRTVDEISQARLDRRVKDSQAAQAAYVSVLQRRRNHASQKGDGEAVSRYDVLLQQAGAEGK